MDLKTILPILETYPRRTVTTKTNKGNTISYTNLNTVTINTETTYNNVKQVCLLNYNNTTYLYINHTTRRTRNKHPINEIETLVIT